MSAVNFSLDGKHVLVTGAGRGIGRACALALAAAGAKLTLVSRSGDEIEALAEDINTAYSPGRAEALVCDCSDATQINQRLGSDGPDRIWDVLLNNAGTNSPQPFTEVDEATFDRIVQVNVKGAFFVAQAVARRLIKARRAGSIINMSSQMGLVGGARRSVYCASKHAVEGMTKAMAIDLAADKIRVNSVCPTFVLTPMTKPFFEDKAFASDVLARIPLGEVATLDDVTGAVVFLASDAARMITGSAIKVDGGWTAI